MGPKVFGKGVNALGCHNIPIEWDSRTRKSLSLFHLGMANKQKPTKAQDKTKQTPQLPAVRFGFFWWNKILLQPHHVNGGYGIFRQIWGAFKHRQKMFFPWSGGPACTLSRWFSEAVLQQVWQCSCKERQPRAGGYTARQGFFHFKAYAGSF